MKNVLLILITGLVLNGCTHYESRLALGAVAGAATGALVADSTTPYYGGHGGGYRQPYYSGNKGYGYNYQYRDHRYGNSSQVDGRSYPGTHRPSPDQYPYRRY